MTSTSRRGPKPAVVEPKPVSGSDRRRLLRSALSAAGLVLAGCAARAGGRGGGPRPDEAAGEAEVTPGEDLMQEHGVLERILLVYDEAGRRIEGQAPLDVAVVARAAGLVRRFVEEYHERLEEQIVFPRLERAGREVELVAILRRQHLAGREVTGEIQRLARAGTTSPELARLMRSFERMYRPHAAREDTVLFPAFRHVTGADAYRELGERFEAREHAVLGAGGFEHAVTEVARLETALGIADLAQFTPR
jgi:hemerythrin-like domain-containing protein